MTARGKHVCTPHFTAANICRTACSGKPSVIPVTRTYAADNCQHFTHSHYHFPYAHYDEYLYQGHGLIGGSHYNYYHNTYHGDFIQKFCPGQ